GERRGPVVVGHGVMLLHPHRVEAELLGAGHLLQRLSVVVPALDGNEADLECHGLSSKSLGYHRALTLPAADGYVPRCLAPCVTRSSPPWLSSPRSSCTARSSVVWPCRRAFGRSRCGACRCSSSPAPPSSSPFRCWRREPRPWRSSSRPMSSTCVTTSWRP